MEKNKFTSYIYSGIFFLTMSTLMLEILLIRIFSVTLWYHFAFLVVSLALFGLGASGVYIYTSPKLFRQEKALSHASIFSTAFSLSILVSFLLFLGIHFFPGQMHFSSIMSLALIYFICSVPFFFSGLCTSIILMNFSTKVSKIYSFDLMGAGIGCFLIFPTLYFFDGPTSIIIISLLAAIASILFSVAFRSRKRLMTSFSLLLIFFILIIINSQTHIIKLDFIKGRFEKKPLIVSWNSISRVAVYPRAEVKNILTMQIDGSASTQILKFDGNLQRMRFLKGQIFFVSYHLKKNANILIIGPGGGRDVLAALAFGYAGITGVEINPIMIDMVNNKFGEFTNRLYQRPDVNIIVDEGRNFIRRSKKKYDIILGSLVDTWAATTSGAFALSENNLYTTEAFIDYLNHLNEDGILSFTRFILKPPRQTIRLVSLALAASEKLDITNPKSNLAIIGKDNLANFIFKKSPFTQNELSTIRRICIKNGFKVIYLPKFNMQRIENKNLIYDSNVNRLFYWLINNPDKEALYEQYPFDIRPPTDDKPFFFFTVKPMDIFKFKAQANETFGYQPIRPLDLPILMLFILLIIAIIFTAGFILFPLIIKKSGSLKDLKENSTMLLYFACLGAGFIIVEISLMQKFILFLGHPIYSTTVILFSLLVFCGIGSRITNSFNLQKLKNYLIIIIIGIALLLFIYNYLLTPLFHSLLGINLFSRISMAVILLIPLGLLMGMPFPMGIKIIDKKANKMIPWVWGINGSTSVLGSIVAVILAISSGFNFALLTGLCIYLAALLFSTVTSY